MGDSVESLLQSVPNVVGSMVLDLQGGIVSSSGDMDNSLEVAASIYRLLQDANSILAAGEQKQNSGFRKMTVSFKSSNFVIAMTKTNIIAMKQSIDA